LPSFVFLCNSSMHLTEARLGNKSVSMSGKQDWDTRLGSKTGMHVWDACVGNKTGEQVCNASMDCVFGV